MTINFDNLAQMYYNIFANLCKWLTSQLPNQLNKLSLLLTLLGYTTCAGWRFRNWLSTGSFYCLKEAPTMRPHYVGRRLRDEKFAQGELWCSRCDQFHPVIEFNESKSNPEKNYGYRPHCRKCDQDRYLEKRDDLLFKYNKRNVALKAKFVELAGGKCQECGYDTFIASLEFHHVCPTEKDYRPSYIIVSGDFEKSWAELDKCCLLCANCHAAFEAGQLELEFIKRDGLLGWTVKRTNGEWFRLSAEDLEKITGLKKYVAGHWIRGVTG